MGAGGTLADEPPRKARARRRRHLRERNLGDGKGWLIRRYGCATLLYIWPTRVVDVRWKLELREFEDVEAVRWVADLVRRWWRLELAFADEKGYVLNHAAGKIIPSDNEFC